jgi:hypothetical protein
VRNRSTEAGISPQLADKPGELSPAPSHPFRLLRLYLNLNLSLFYCLYLDLNLSLFRLPRHYSLLHRVQTRTD